jgi:phosphoglycerol transferase MdoB-like AlkP superfamily enzyme
MYNLKNIKTEPVFALVCNFLLLMFIYSLCRVFFFLVNKSYFEDVTFSHFLNLCRGGLRFDISALLIINSLYFVLQLIPFKFRLNSVYQSVAKWFFIILNSVMIIINCMDIAFFRFTNRRTTSTIFSEFKHEDNIFQVIANGFATYWYITIFAIAMILILCIFYYKPKSQKNNLSPLIYYPMHCVVFILIAYFTVIGIRGGFGAFTRPITLSNANEYVNKSNETAIVLNTPFCILRTIDKKVYKKPKYFNNKAEMAAVFSPIQKSKPNDKFKPLNVVIIILESFGKEYSGFFNQDLNNGTYKGYTPFLDSLYAEGFTFKYSYSNGRKSIDAMPSILSSIPMFIEPYIVTSYSTNDISSIAAALKEKGYYSAFFHGAPNGSMGFQAYAKSAGFDDYFGLNEYGNKDLDGTWAVWDEKFLQFYADKMGELPQPFVSSVFTATSHDPFKIPKLYEDNFPEGTLPIHKTIGYSDYAIKQFFEKMSGYDWFENTLFIITADHTNQSQFAEYHTDLNIYSVPILFYHPGSNLKGFDTKRPVQQIDIMPSILGYLNYDKPYFAFGNDLFSKKDTTNFVVNYNNNIYQLLQNDYLLQFDGEKTRAVYNYKTDSLLEQNLLGEVKEQDKMETLLKAIIQQYIVRMTENRLTVNHP